MERYADQLRLPSDQDGDSGAGTDEPKAD